MKVDEEKNLGDAVVDREIGPGFTPGPWHVLQGDRCYHVASTDRTFETACIMFAGGEGSGEANARLIAAAPALYAALADLAFSHDARDRGDGCWCSLENGQTHFERTGAHERWCLGARAAFALVSQPATVTSEV